jgi:hypothetical protein
LSQLRHQHRSAKKESTCRQCGHTVQKRGGKYTIPDALKEEIVTRTKTMSFALLLLTVSPHAERT